MILSREAIQRMTNSTGVGGIGRNGRAGGGGGEDDMSNYATLAAVENGYISKDFFNQLFAVHVNDHIVVTDDGEVISDNVVPRTLLPNEIMPDEPTVETDPTTGYVTTTTTTLASIEAKSNFWSSLAISALGQGSGGGGGGATALSQLVDVQLSNLQNGQALVYDSTLEKWVNANVQGGSTAWADITGKPTTIAGYGITDAKIVSGTITLGADSITPLTSSDISDMATQTWVGKQGFLKSVAFGDLTSHPSTLSGYGITDAVSNATTWWGRSVNNNVVVGNIDMNNGDAINFKNSGGTLKSVLTLNQNNILIIGYGTNNSDYATQLRGAGISFYTYNNSAELNVGEFSKSGRFWIKQATQGLRIGNGLLTWDSANNALKVSDYNGNSANLYALGGVSALGFSSSGGTSSINSLTVNDSILVKDYAGNSKKALSVALAASASDASRLIIGEGWKDLYHDTVISGYHIRFDAGQLANAVTINNAGMATFNYYLKSSRYYLDGSRYLYLSGSNLYYYNGSTSIQIA